MNKSHFLQSKISNCSVFPGIPSPSDSSIVYALGYHISKLTSAEKNEQLSKVKLDAAN